MPKMVYGYLDEDLLVLVSWCLQLAYSTKVQPYGLVKDVLIEIRSSTLVDYLVMDMDPHQQKSIIFGSPFLKSIKAAINERKEIINMKVDGKHEKFTFHPKNPASKGSKKVEYVEVLPYEPKHLKQHDSSQSKGPNKHIEAHRKKSDTAKYSKPKTMWHVKNATPTAPPSPVALVN
jgi:hypothetical protein